MLRTFSSAVVAFVILGSGTASAAVVTLCQSDVQTGPDAQGAPGVNLTTALLQGGRVTFACGALATIRITRTHVINRNTEIEGMGVIALDAADRVRIFRISQPGIVFRLSGLVLQRGHDRPPPGGRSAGGGVVSSTGDTTVEFFRCGILRSRTPIRSFGTVRLQDSWLADNTGTVLRARNITMTRSQIYRTDGVAIQSEGGKVDITDSEVLTSRGSRFEKCTLSVVRTRFRGNKSESGGAFYTNCQTNVEGGAFENNEAAADGGAIYADMLGTKAINVRGTRFEANSAAQYGGAVAVGLGWPGEVLRLRHVTFLANRAKSGGGVHLGNSPNSVSLEGSALVFAKNSALAEGGALWAMNSRLTIGRGVFVENHAGASGGAISVVDYEPPGSRGAAQPKPRVLANVLLVRNKAAKGSAFIGSGAQFINSTIADNEGAALYPSAPSAHSWRVIQFANTLLAGNGGGNCASVVGGPGYADRGSNLQYPAAECGSSIPVAEPVLDEFYVPWLGSPALNAGNNDVCSAQPVAGKDVYGHRRPHRERCTIGAAETDVEDLVRRQPRMRERGIPRRPGRPPESE